MFGKNIISSSTDFHQGYPLAGLQFLLNLQPVIEQIELEVPDLDLNEWYLEDGTQVGTREDLQKVVDVIQREGPGRGLHLSTAATVPQGTQPKSTVWSPEGQEWGEDPLARGIFKIQEHGIVLLGAPVGD